ncbi:MAG: hypothetical protein F083_2543, partial [bacterium F083]
YCRNFAVGDGVLFPCSLFAVILLHPQVQFIGHLLQEGCTVVKQPHLNIPVGDVAVCQRLLEIQELHECREHILQRYVTVVDALLGVESIDKFYKVRVLSRPS